MPFPLKEVMLDLNVLVPISSILSLISVEMVFNRLSKVRLLSRCDNDSPHALIILLLYGKSKDENDAMPFLNQI